MNRKTFSELAGSNSVARVQIFQREGGRERVADLRPGREGSTIVDGRARAPRNFSIEATHERNRTLTTFSWNDESLSYWRLNRKYIVSSNRSNRRLGCRRRCRLSFRSISVLFAHVPSESSFDRETLTGRINAAYGLGPSLNLEGRFFLFSNGKLFRTFPHFACDFYFLKY